MRLFNEHSVKRSLIEERTQKIREMIFEKTPLEGLLIIKPKIFADDRGYFFESFHKERFEAAYGKPVEFVQDNETIAQEGVGRERGGDR